MKMIYEFIHNIYTSVFNLTSLRYLQRFVLFRLGSVRTPPPLPQNQSEADTSSPLPTTTTITSAVPKNIVRFTMLNIGPLQ